LVQGSRCFYYCDGFFAWVLWDSVVDVIILGVITTLSTVS
jgi:hypothetical protein